MRKAEQDVAAFFKASGQDVAAVADTKGPAAWYLSDVQKQLERYVIALKSYDGVAALRVRLMVEELAETIDALLKGDRAGVADGLIDLLYVTLGAAVAFDIPVAEVWDEVHTANMRKFVACPVPLCGPTCGQCHGSGLVRCTDASGKVTKPPGWQPPDVEAALQRGDDRRRSERVQRV